MEDISNEESPNPFLTVIGKPEGRPKRFPLLDQVKAILTLDKKKIQRIPHSLDSTTNAVILIFLSLILDFLGFSGFDFRLTSSNFELYFQLFVIQPLFLLLLAVIFRISLDLHGIKQETSLIFIMIGYAHIWTIISGIIGYFLFNSGFLAIVYFLVFDVLYLSPIILAFVDNNRMRYFAIGFTMHIVFFIAFFVIAIPFLLVFH